MTGFQFNEGIPGCIEYAIAGGYDNLKDFLRNFGYGEFPLSLREIQDVWFLRGKENGTEDFIPSGKTKNVVVVSIVGAITMRVYTVEATLHESTDNRWFLNENDFTEVMC